MYCVRTNGRSCLASTALATSMKRRLKFSCSSSLTVLPFLLAAASMSTSASSNVYSPAHTHNRLQGLG